MTTVAFTGDIAFSGYFKNSWENKFIAPAIIDFLKEADCVVANVESPFTERNIDSARPINHVSSPKAVDRLLEMNANVWNLSNNHILDCGIEGMLDTMKLAREYNCKPLGVGNTIEEAAEPIIVGDDVKVGIISIIRPWEHIKKSNAAITWDKEDIIKKQIGELKRSVRWIVIVVHGGDEYSNMPMPWSRKMYMNFLEWGADVVVGHHPHLVQNYETIGEKIIFYSLGNFIFDTDNQRSYRYTDAGILIKLGFSDERIDWESIATKINREEQRIEVGIENAIFCDIGKKDYGLLWPMAAKEFDANDIQKKRKMFPKYMNMPRWEWNLYRIKGLRRRYNLILLLGRILAFFKIGRLSNLREVYKYLSIG